VFKSNPADTCSKESAKMSSVPYFERAGEQLSSDSEELRGKPGN